MRQRLELNVANLDQLNSTLNLLEELRDMEIKIDDIYLPIENMYSKLRYESATLFDEFLFSGRNFVAGFSISKLLKGSDVTNHP